MKRYEGKAFVSKNQVGGCEVLGNEGVIYLLEKSEEFDKKLMSEYGLKEGAPMTCFVRRRDDTDEFDISFWNLDGSQAKMCGHISLITANILKDFYNLEKLSLYFDISHYKEKINNQLKMSFDGDFTFFEAKAHDITVLQKAELSGEQAKLIELMGLEPSDVKEIVWANGLRDLTFVINNALKMRSMNMRFGDIAPILEQLDIRNLCSTAKSAENGFDFETRVFCPHDDLDEDKACGSSSIPLTKYWEKEIKKNSFDVLYPYHMGYDEKKVGGTQVIRTGVGTVLVGGCCFYKSE